MHLLKVRWGKDTDVIAFDAATGVTDGVKRTKALIH
jgi:hypothetical protein